MAACSNNSHGVSNGAGSTSTISAVTGWHVLKIEGYSKTKGLLGIGNNARSGTFTVGGHSWCVRYYPDGVYEEDADWICLDLFLNDDPLEDEVIKGKYSFSLLDEAGDPVPVPSFTCGSHICSFSRSNRSCGFIEFIEKARLESSQYLRDDTFSIRCDVTVIKEIQQATTTTVTAPELHVAVAAQSSASNTHGHGHRPARFGTDVTIHVGGKQFNAHRVMLAALSSVLREKLFGPTMDYDAVVHLRIDDVDAKVFSALLQFIYTNQSAGD